MLSDREVPVVPVDSWLMVLESWLGMLRASWLRVLVAPWLVVARVPVCGGVRQTIRNPITLSGSDTGADIQ
jgi:hypothetical protein